MSTLREVSGTQSISKILDSSLANYGSFAKEWSTEGQFKGGSDYVMSAQDSSSSININGDTIGGTNKWELPGSSIYDGVTFELDYGAFTEDNAADTIDWDIPIERVEISHGANLLMTVYYEDFVNSFKWGDSESRISIRRNECFIDTLTGSQPAFTQTINILGIKNYGFSENASKAHQTIPVPSEDKLGIRITMRDQFTIVDGGATTPDRPLITGSRLFASKRKYLNQGGYDRDIGALIKKKQPISVYDGGPCGTVAFTTDASGGAKVQLRLGSVESNYVSAFRLRVRPATQTDINSMNATPFDYEGLTNSIKVNGQEFKQLYTSSFSRESFRRNHRGRSPASEYAVKAVEDGEIIILSSEASIFELEDIRPDFYRPSADPMLSLNAIINLAPTTAYFLDVSAIYMKAIMAMD